MRHRESRTAEDRCQGGGIDRQRVDQGDLVAPGDLDQGQVGHVGAFGVELGVEAVDVHGRDLADQRVEGVVVGDHERRGGHRSER